MKLIVTLILSAFVGCTSGRTGAPNSARDATVLTSADGAVLVDAEQPASTVVDGSTVDPGVDARVSADGSMLTDGSALTDGSTTTQSGSDAGARVDASTPPGSAGWPGMCEQFTQVPSPIPQGATASLIKGKFNFLEGPVWVADRGWLLFSDMGGGGNSAQGWPIATIHRLQSGQTAPAPWLEMANSNGLALTSEGDLLACTHDTQTLSVFDLDSKERQVLAMDDDGDSFNSPNDVTVARDGSYYFTDPDWQLGNRQSETGVTGVYRRAPSGAVTLIDGSLNKPNGITLSLDGRALYVSALDNRIYRYDVAADGSVALSTRTIFIEDGSDGMAIDCAGNLYLTGNGVRIYDRSGEWVETVTVAETTSNVAFGGLDRQTLYITAGTGLYAIDTAVPGSPY